MTPSPAKARAATKRKYRRFLVNQPAMVSCAAVPGLVWTARIADVSRRGMQLILAHPASPGSAVRIQWTNREVRGTVRYRKQRGGEYRIGVAFASCCDSLLIDLLARETVALRRVEQEAAASAAALSQQVHEMATALQVGNARERGQEPVSGQCFARIPHPVERHYRFLGAAIRR